MYKKSIKRILDFIFALLLLPFVLLIILIVGPMIYLEDHGSVFYMAPRRGLHAKVFNIIKLRSMKMNAPDIRNKDDSTYNSPDDVRITRIGKFLRKTSIDELPQVFNILKGDMSFIGPRPITTIKPISEFDSKRWTRLSVRPGLTGYTQAYYRNSIDQETKFQYDAEYAEKVSFSLDLKIFFKTVKTVLKRENIYNAGDQR